MRGFSFALGASSCALIRPRALSLPESDQNRLKNQLKVMRAEHAQYADQTYRNIAFFEKFL